MAANTKLPTFVASPMSDPEDLSVITGYLVFREYWELIDKVFSVETPVPPTRKDIIKLKSALYPHAADSNTVSLMYQAVDDMFLDDLDIDELDKENSIRAIIYQEMLDSPPTTKEQAEKIAQAVRARYESGLASAGVA